MGLARGCGPLTWPRLGSRESGRGRRARVRGILGSGLWYGRWHGLTLLHPLPCWACVCVELDLLLCWSCDQVQVGG